jgi:hypothetical protein
MQNLYQPYVNLLNANIETLARFVNAQEVKEAAKEGVSKSARALQENTSKIAGSNAYEELTKATIDNYVRFTNEWLQNVSGIVLQGQQFVKQQAEEGQRRLSEVADLSRRSVESAAQSGKSAAEEVSQQQRRSK